MGKNGKKAQAGKPKKPTPKDISKRLNALAKKVEDELNGADLFAPLPPTEDCAICLVPLSRLVANSTYFTCCGQTICDGCSGERQALIKKQNAVIKKQNEENADEKDKKPIANTCPFCRELTSSWDQYVRQLESRALKNDHVALTSLGIRFMKGSYGVPKDDLKALDYWIRAAEFGSPDASGCIAACYANGRGISKDMGRTASFYLVGALRGCILARHNIGEVEYKLGNHEIGIRHWKIAAEAGSQPALDLLKRIYNADGKKPGKEFISKDCMDSLYRVCHDAQEEVKSEGRKKHGHDATNMKC